MFDLFLQSIYFILPVYVSNMVLVFLYFKFLKNITTGPLGWPLDFNIKVGRDQQPLIGAHKRWEGLITTALVAISVVAVQRWLYPFFYSFSIIDYQVINIYFVGGLLGAGSFLGDATKSFIKRRLKFRPHSSFPILDQIDHPLGALLLSYYWLRPSVAVMITVLLVTIPLVLVVNFVSYKLKIKDVWW